MMNTFLTKIRQKHQTFLLAVLLAGSGAWTGACSNSDHPGTPEPPKKPEPHETFSMKLAGTKVEELIQVADNQTTTLDTAEAEVYFGKRIELAAPLTLSFTEDSLRMEKASGRTEHYRIRWNGKELQTYNDKTGQWSQPYGALDADGNFCLTTGFYIRQTDEYIPRTLLHIGQAYGLGSYQAICDNYLTTTWAKVIYTYQQPSE